MLKNISKNQTQHKIDLTLDRVFKALEILCKPQNNLPPTIHIAGTNGKGSTIAFMRAIFEAAGYKCHVYTSPHLVKFNERIVIAGQEISDKLLENLITEVNTKCAELNLTFFETTTLVAFLAFSRYPADVLLLETGMGGQFDATNILEKPLLEIITPISYDHMEFLGDTIEKIAYEKACIIKPKTLCIISKQTDAAKQVLFDYAKKVNAKIMEADLNIRLPKPSLNGAHQYINAACAVAAIKKVPQFKITEANIITGIKFAKWLGRIQKIGENTYLDGAHNIGGAEIIADFIKKNKTNNKAIIILGMLKNKDITGYLEKLKNSTDKIIAVNIEGENSLTANELSAKANELKIDSVAIENISDALNYAKQNHPNDLVIICGSLYLAGKVLSRSI